MIKIIWNYLNVSLKGLKKKVVDFVYRVFLKWSNFYGKKFEKKRMIF